MKKRLSICLDDKLIKLLDYIREKKYENLISRSRLIEFFLREPVLEMAKKIQEEESSRRGRVLVA